MRICALFLAAISALAQQPARFEVASVRPTDPILNQVKVGFAMDGHFARLTAIPLYYYVSVAYKVKPSQVVGPDHLQNRYDINGTVSEGTKQDQLPELMEGLLNDRFQIKAHRENRETQVYVLTTGKGPLKITEVDDIPEDLRAPVTGGGTGSTEGVSLSLGNGASFTFANNKWEGKRLTFEEIAAQLEQFLDHPIVDQTGRKGRYDLTLEITPDDYQMMRARGAVNAGFPIGPKMREALDTAQFPSLYAAFEKLGLKLETRKLPQPFVIVDSILKTPIEN
jgi:uncharacterized protein (TIGR03435 family)